MEPAQQAQLLDLLKVTLPAVIAIVGTLAGGFLGHRYATHQTRTAKSIDFAERRVRELYSPMVGYIRKVHALSALRKEISDASNAAWWKICEQHPVPFLDHEKYFEPFRATIEYDNNQMYAEILPAYDKMVEVFTQNYWLASTNVQEHYAELCGFVELWHRYKERSIPMETLQELAHTEARLHQLYSLLESELLELRTVVAYKEA